MSLPHISPTKAKALINGGAILIDIRDMDEHARERIPLAQNRPLSKLGENSFGKDQTAIIFHCKSGNRTSMNAALLAQVAQVDAFILDGGIEAWKKAGLPIAQDRKQPIEIMRQVQITAGGLSLAGVLLGFIINPAFYVLSGAIGAGLMFSGITGSCAMARVLKILPWNRVVA